MNMIVNNTIIFFVLLLICSCHQDAPTPPETALEVVLTTSTSEIGHGEALTVSIVVNNADSLYALAFELIYNPNIFDTDTTAISVGALFSDPFLISNANFLSPGVVPVSLAELGNIQGSVSGTACSIILTSKNIGSDLLYISTLHMIKKGSANDINEFNTLSIEPIEVQVVE